MRIVAVALAAVCGLLAFSRSAEARVDIQVDLASQTMVVSSASGTYAWPISSARSGFRTPRGSYGVKRMEVMHRSRKYHNSPMPHSLFFSGGYAIHGTYEVGSLGRPASHGCIRIAPENAAALFQMVRAEGARIAIRGTTPVSEIRYARRSTERGRYASSARHSGGYARRVTQDPDDPYALGYAPVYDPGVVHWMTDPSDF